MFSMDLSPFGQVTQACPELRSLKTKLFSNHIFYTESSFNRIIHNFNSKQISISNEATVINFTH